MLVIGLLLAFPALVGWAWSGQSLVAWSTDPERRAASEARAESLVPRRRAVLAAAVYGGGIVGGGASSTMMWTGAGWTWLSGGALVCFGLAVALAVGYALLIAGVLGRSPAR